MAIFPNLKNLLIPHKGKVKGQTLTPEEIDDNNRAIEVWSRQPIIQLVAGSGITLTPSSGLATDSNGNGPHSITIAASGGGGGGITLLVSPNSTITITNASGPTTDVDVNIPQNQSVYENNQNTAYGNGSMFTSFSNPFACTAFGSLTLENANTGAVQETAVGYGALQTDTSGTSNTAIGYLTLNALTTGINNVAVGASCLPVATTAQYNVAVGSGCGVALTTGQNNVALGYKAFNHATTASSNVVIGDNAAQSLLSGGTNVIIGNIAGNSAIVGGSNNVAIGNNTQTSTPDVSHTTSIGASAFCNANGGVAIGVDSGGIAAESLNANDFTLGSASHVIQFSNSAHTGSGSALLGSNCPASTLTAPHGWIEIRNGLGAIGYFPYWT